MPPELLEKLLLKHDYQLTVERNGMPERTRSYIRWSGLGPTNNLCVKNPCVDVCERALLTRSLFVKVGEEYHEPLRVATAEYTSNPFLTEFSDRVAAEVRQNATVSTLREVVRAYRGPKLATYQRAYESLGYKPLSQKDRRLLQFIKFGKDEEEKAGRLINPPSARYGLSLGCYLKKNEHLFFDAINKVWGEHTKHTVIKGLDIYEAADVLRAKWDRFEDPVLVELDVTKLDACVSVPALSYEHGVYNKVFNSNRLATLLKWQLSSKSIGFFQDGVVKARFPGKRCSGDLNTSLGNCLIMCGLIFAYAKEREVNSELANNGDDCGVIMERRDVERFVDTIQKWFKKHGFWIKVDGVVDKFEEIEFCQNHPVHDGKKWRMVRNVFTCLKKDPMCLKSITSEKTLNKWRGAVGRCGLSLATGMPVLQSFYQCLMKNTRKCTVRFARNMLMNNNTLESRGARLDILPTTITAEARSSFATAFGILPAEQIAMERYYDHLTLSDELGQSVLTPVPLIELSPLVFDC